MSPTCFRCPLALLVTGEESTPGSTRLYIKKKKKTKKKKKNTGHPTHMPIVTALAWCKLLVPKGLC